MYLLRLLDLEESAAALIQVEYFILIVLRLEVNAKVFISEASVSLLYNIVASLYLNQVL